MHTGKNDNQQLSSSYWGALFAFVGGLAVILGAFGAHGLEDQLTPESIDAYQTAVQYQFLHVLSGLLVIALSNTLNLKWPRLILTFQLLGIILFSGSIYLLSTKSLTGIEWSFLGPITPIGGVFFIISWLLLAISFLTSAK